MNILMLTNIYRPLVGGITRSLEQFTTEFRRRGHRVLIVAPEHDDAVPEPDVIRYPSLPKVFRHRYSFPLPLPGFLTSAIPRDFVPDVVHSHHPFLLGSVARRQAQARGVPLVYTHHTNYKENIEAEGQMPEVLVDFFVRTIIQYCNACDAVIAPSDGLARLLAGRGVTRRIEVIPTGLDPQRFAQGDGGGFRQRYGIPHDAAVVGTLGRIEPEKNLDFLAEAVARLLHTRPTAHFVMVGSGRMLEPLAEWFAQRGLSDRVHQTGVLDGQQVVDAYHAMNVFAFASKTETQGMVLTEAMACGVPVVALAAHGVDDVLRDQENGRRLEREDPDLFAAALDEILGASPPRRRALAHEARETARQFTIAACATRTLNLYASLPRAALPEAGGADLYQRLEQEWHSWGEVLDAANRSLEKFFGESGDD